MAHQSHNWAAISETNRPDAPDLDGAQCEIARCREPAKVTAWSSDLKVWFCYCADHADEKTTEYSDLEVID